MIADLKPYPAMKDSGVEWLREVPEHWESRKLRNILRSVTARNRPDLPLLSVVRERGVIVRDISSRDENPNFIPDDLTNYKVVRVGQFAVNKMKAWQGSYGVSDHEGIVSPAYFVFELDGVFGAFFNRAIRSRAYVPFFTQASDGVRIGQWDLSQTRMREIEFFMPSPPEQVAIVTYLDLLDRRLRRLIRAKRERITLLTEQKQVIIHQAVARGLDPDVPLKDSGIERLGQVPEHWEVGRLWQFFTLQRGFDITRDSQRVGTVPVVSSGGISSFHDEATGKGPGVLVGRKGTAGSVHWVDTDYWAHDTTLFVNDFKGNVPRFVYYSLATLDLVRFDTGSANPTINRNLVHPEPLAFPPPEEQDLISATIDKAIAAIDESMARAESAIELLVEYRNRLIADVVTGNFDVREVVAALPAVDPFDAEDIFDDTPETYAVADFDGITDEVEA